MISTLGVNCGLSSGRSGVIERRRQLNAVSDILLDDQGGQQISVRTEGKAPTLRAETHGNLPCVIIPVPYTLKIRSGCEGGGKGAPWQEDMSATLATNNDQYLFQPVSYDARGNGDGSTVSTITGDHENRITDYSSVVVEPTPTVMEPFCKSTRARSADDATTWVHGRVANTLNTFDLGETRANELVVQSEPVYCLQGNGIDRADTAGCNGKGVKEDISYTLNTIDRPAVVYAVDQGGGKSGANVSEDTAPTLCTTHGGEPAVAYGINGDVAGTLDANYYKGCGLRQGVEREVVAYQDRVGSLGLDRASFNQGKNAQFNFSVLEEQQPTLTAKGPGAVCHGDPPRYIVRRLTPTECARLQGFPDWWGYIEAVETLSQKDYQFWLNVRNTHDAINGRKPKDYTVKQMLTWYNKLWTDSAEYKMWGNGIALPCALYVMQGIEDALMGEDCA